MSGLAAQPAPYALELRSRFDRLLYVFAQLEPHEVDNVQLDNGWTPKGLLAHVAFWDTVQRCRMERALAGATSFALPAGDNDNRAAQELRPFAAVLAEAEAARAALVDFAATLPATALAHAYPEDDHTLSLDKLLRHMVNHTSQHTRDLFAYVASLRRWGRAGLRDLLDVQHNLLMDSIAGLDEETILTTRVAGGWSLRDQLVHVLAWSEYMYHVLVGWPAVAPAAIAEWIRAPGESEDAVNARTLQNRATMTMIEVVDMHATWHRRTLARIDALDDATLASKGDFGWGEQGELCHFLYSMCLHQAEHALEIWEVRA